MLSHRPDSVEWQQKKSAVSTIVWVKGVRASRLQNVDMSGFKSLVRKVYWTHHLPSVTPIIKPWLQHSTRNIQQLTDTKLKSTCRGHFLTRPFSRTINRRMREKIHWRSSLDRRFLMLYSASARPMPTVTFISVTAKASTLSLGVFCRWWPKRNPSGPSVVSLRTSCPSTTSRTWWAPELTNASSSC